MTKYKVVKIGNFLWGGALPNAEYYLNKEFYELEEARKCKPPDTDSNVYIVVEFKKIEVKNNKHGIPNESTTKVRRVE